VYDKRFKRAAKVDRINTKGCKHAEPHCRCFKNCRHGRWREILPGAPQEYCTEDGDPHLLRTDRKESPGITIQLSDKLIKEIEAITIHDRADQHSTNVYQIAEICDWSE
jgi:hypothetical protein